MKGTERQLRRCTGCTGVAQGVLFDPVSETRVLCLRGLKVLFQPCNAWASSFFPCHPSNILFHLLTPPTALFYLHYKFHHICELASFSY